MKNRGYYIDAFTVFEAAITMVISAVIILVVYELFVIVQVQFTNHIRFQDETISYQLFETQLQKDILLSTSLTYDHESSLRLEVAGDEVVYAFAKAHTIRKGKRIDTFAIGVKDLKYAVKKQPTDTKHVLSGRAVVLETEVLLFQSKRMDRSVEINTYFNK